MGKKNELYIQLSNNQPINDEVVKNGPDAAMAAAHEMGYFRVCKELRKATRELANKCAVCGKRPGPTVTLKACSKCRMVFYCCVEEQKRDWKDKHKKACAALQQADSDEDARHNLMFLVEKVDTQPWPEFARGEVLDWGRWFALRPAMGGELPCLDNEKGVVDLAFLPGVPGIDQCDRTCMRLKSDELSYAATLGRALLLAGVNMNKGASGGGGGGGGSGGGGGGDAAAKQKDGDAGGGKKTKKRSAKKSPPPRAPSYERGGGVTIIDIVGSSITHAESQEEMRSITVLVLNLCAMFPDRGELLVRAVSSTKKACKFSTTAI